MPSETPPARVKKPWLMPVSGARVGAVRNGVGVIGSKLHAPAMKSGAAIRDVLSDGRRASAPLGVTTRAASPTAGCPACGDGTAKAEVESGVECRQLQSRRGQRQHLEQLAHAF